MTQQSIYGKGYSKTPKLFKFVLQTKDDGAKQLRYAPENWNEGELTFIRNKTYKGVFESYSTDELTFVKDGRDFVQRAYERGGIDYEVSIYIYIQNNATFKYELYFAGKLDLSTYKIDSIGVTCEVIPSGFQDVVLNREDLNVNLNSLKFIGGGVGSMEQLANVVNNVTIPEYQATENSDWSIGGQLAVIPKGEYRFILCPALNTFTEYEEGITFSQVMELLPNDDPTGKIVKFALDTTLIIKIDLKAQLISYPQESGSNYHMSLFLVKNGVNYIEVTGTVINNTYSNEYTFNYSTEHSFVAGDELSLLAYVYSSKTNFIVEFNNGNISFVKELQALLPEINVPMFYIYEAFVRTLQLISGQSFPFYSELLGRTDSLTESYPQDGEASLMAITRGKYIRGFKASTNEINMSLKDLFATINAIHNIGLGFEIISGQLRVRVEKEQYFFDITENPNYPTEPEFYQVNQILDLSVYLNNEVITKEVLPDWYANEIEGGYNKYEYENIQGLKEFNTNSSWAIPIKAVKNKVNLVSPYRADTQGVNKLRGKPASTFPTEDVTGDSDIFIFDVKRGGLYPFTAKTNEDFNSVTGGVDPSQSYNLNFTPRRNMERHGSRIRSMQLAAGDEIQWLRSDKNTALVTYKTGEVEPKAERDDVLVNDLPLGYWIPESYNFKCPVNLQTLTAIKNNPRGVIKIDTDKYGWILDVQTNNQDKMGEFKLLRCDLRNVKILTGD